MNKIVAPMRQAARKFKNRRLTPLLHPFAKRFECPVCFYRGPFRTVSPVTGNRKHAQCPCCGALERHRLQCWCLRRLFDQHDFSRFHILHFAPESHLRMLLEPRAASYETADLYAEGVDHKVDIQALPFKNSSYDFIYASHVLEHVADDDSALAEIRRILTPEGIAILPVPIISGQTIEYPKPNPNESGHVRAPGYDYFDRYRAHFTQVECIDSFGVPESYQTYIYENRTCYPNESSPLRPKVSGKRHPDVVPICYVRGDSV